MKKAEERADKEGWISADDPKKNWGQQIEETEHNYVFYLIKDDVIKITDIYHEKEDFMWKLFGIKTTTGETEDYWAE